MAVLKKTVPRPGRFKPHWQPLPAFELAVIQWHLRTLSAIRRASLYLDLEKLGHRQLEKGAFKLRPAGALPRASPEGVCG